jgi:hypothetical protein
MREAIVAWGAEDVLVIFGVSATEAEAFLHKHAAIIEERMIEIGWEVIETLGDLDGLPRIEEKEQEENPKLLAKFKCNVDEYYLDQFRGYVKKEEK